MLAPDPTKNTVHCGPYLETNTLHAVILEAALTAVQAAGEFRTLIKPDGVDLPAVRLSRSEEHTSELQSLMRIPYAVFCLKTKDSNNLATTDRHKSTKHY